MLTASEIHQRLGIPTGTLRRWSHEGHIRPLALSRRFNLYSPWQVIAHALRRHVK